MREALGQDFEGNAKHIVCSTVEEALKYSAYPGMMKPVDSQGQRGCFRVDSIEDIRNNFEKSLSFSFDKKVIIEEYIEGPEVSINAYMQGGEMKFAIVSDRYAFDELPGGIIKEHRIPSSFADDRAKEKSIDLARRIADKLNITDGPCYFQIKLQNGNKPFIIEVTPRLDGCHMWNLIKHYCGVDLLDAAFRQLLSGESVLDEGVVFPNDEYQLLFLSKEPNSTFSISEFDVHGAEYICYYYDEGDRILKINGYIEKCGYIIRRTGRLVD